MTKKGTLVMVDGRTVKSVNVSDVDDSTGWTYLSGAPETGNEKNTFDYFKAVPWLRRGVAMIATGVATMPFTISSWSEDSGPGKKQLDNSENYLNKVKFMPSPTRLLWLMAASRQLTGKAYLFRQYNQNSYTKSLKYFIPTSVTPEFTDKGEIDKWKRQYQVNGQVKEDSLKPEEIVYSWYADPYTEVGPPHSYPALAALDASGVLFNLDEAVSGFFKGGLVKQTVFTVPANTMKEERERVENVLTRTLMGVRNLVRGAKVFNADAFNATVIGDGIEGLEASGITSSKREDIAAAFGIPMSKLFSTDAGGLGGGGVVEQDEQNFLRETLLPETKAIFEDLNQQVFHLAKYHIEINEQNIDAFQEDETARSVAVQSLASAISLNPVAAEFAMNLLGYELSEEQKSMLEDLKAQKEEQRQAFSQRVQQNGNKPNVEPDELPNEKFDQKTLKELSAWQNHALKRSGKDSADAFNSHYLKEPIATFIRESLAKTKTKENIKALFAAVRKGLSPTLMAAVKSALNKATTAKKVDAIFADLAKESKHAVH